MLKKTYLRKAMLLLETEIELLKLLFLHPTLSLINDVQPPISVSGVHFIPKSDGLGIDAMGELVVSLGLSGHFRDGTGRPAPFILIANAMEAAFNFRFGDIYKTKARIFRRKPYNLTRALDYLANLIARESRNRKKKDEKR